MILSEIFYMSAREKYRVVRFDSAGNSVQVFGGIATNNGSKNTNGAIATTQGCYRAEGIVVDEVLDRLYVACYDHHAVKYIEPASDSDTNNILAFNAVGKQNSAGKFVAGTGTTGDSGGGTTGSPLYWPRALALDSSGNLYIFQRNKCDVKVWNRSSSSLDFYGGGISVASDKVTRIAGISCSNASANGQYSYTSSAYHDTYQIGIHESGGMAKGIILSNRQRHLVQYTNLLNTPVTYGGRTISANSTGNIAGRVTALFGGDGGESQNSFVTNPRGLVLSTDGNTVFVGDEANNRVRAIDLSIPDGEINTIVGNSTWYRGSDLTAVNPANSARFSYPNYGTILNGKLYISDRVNDRVKSLDLLTGEVSSAVGIGAGNLNEGAPATIRFRELTGLATVGDGIPMMDNQRYASSGSSANQNCALRYYNPSFENLNFFTVNLEPNYVTTIAGNYALGCSGWTDAAFEGASLTDVSPRGEGLAYVNGEIFLTDFYRHCIYKMRADGSFTRVIGQCTTGSWGNSSNVAKELATLREPRDIAPDPIHGENYFFSDQWRETNSIIKYVNNTLNPIEVGGITVPAGYVSSVFQIGSNRLLGIAAYGNWVCGASGHEDSRYSNQSVYCFDRTGNSANKVFGQPLATAKSSIANGFEQEGISATSAKFYKPYGLIFDNEGNLYVIEERAHKVRKIMKWW